MSPVRARTLVRQPMVRVAAMFVMLAIVMTATATVAQSPVYDLFTRAGEQSDRTRPEPRQSRPEQPLPGDVVKSVRPG